MVGEQRFAGFSFENELAQRHHDMIPGTAKQNLLRYCQPERPPQDGLAVASLPLLES
jgi:hypothetical protein